MGVTIQDTVCTECQVGVPRLRMPDHPRAQIFSEMGAQ
jgi:hypothetical protein